jgi:peroxiredoxin
MAYPRCVIGLSRVVKLRRVLLAALVLPALLVAALYLLRDSGSGETVTPAALIVTPAGDVDVGLEAGLLAPDFEITTTDGRRIRLSDFRGTPLVVNFHALWCTSCLTELPEIKAALEERGLDAFAVLAINAGESKARALEFVEYLDAPFTYGLDTDLTVSDAYRVWGLPATVFIDAAGVVQAVYYGYTGPDVLDLHLDAVIAAKPPGEVPTFLRTVTSIPRDRVLTVNRDGDDLRFESRSLRCDAGYCAEPVITALTGGLGLEIVEAGYTARMPYVRVRFEASAITEQQVIDAVAVALGRLEDPAYRGELRVAPPEG